MQLRRRVELGVCLGLLYSLVTYWVASITGIRSILGTDLTFLVCPAFWVSFLTFVLSSWFRISLSSEAIFLISLAVGGVIGGLIGYLTGRRRRTRGR